MMTVISLSYPVGRYKLYSQNTKNLKDLISPKLESRIRFYIRLESPQRGGRKLGKLQRIRELFIGRDDYIYAGFHMADAEAGDTHRFVRLCKLEEVV